MVLLISENGTVLRQVLNFDRCTVNVYFRILKMIATSGFLPALECTKFVFGRGSTLDPSGELTVLPRVLHWSGSGKIPRETVGVPREREGRPPFIPRECRERDCLLRESCGTGSKRRSPPVGAGITPGSLVSLLLLLFGLYLPLSLY